MSKTTADTRKLLRSGWRMLLLFEILYRVFSRFVVYTSMRALFNACLRLTGLRYVGVENIVRFLTQPIMLAACAVVFLVFSLTTMIEFSCVLTCLHAARHGKTYGIPRIIIEGAKDAVRLLRPRNWPLLLFTAMLIPVLQLPNSRSMIRLINLPWSALKAFALEMPWCLCIGAYLLALAACICLFTTTYAYYVIEDISFGEAIRKAYATGYGRRLRDAASVILFAVAGSLIAFGGTALLSRLIARAAALITSDANLQYRIRLPFDVAFSLVKSCLPVLCVLGCTAAIYYAYKVREHLPLPRLKQLTRLDGTRENRVLLIVALAVSLISILLYDTILRPTLVRLDAFDVLDARQTLVIAHRGFTPDLDENTLSAFRAAAEVGVDYIELDVQLTSDGVLIVNHDNTYNRVFGDKRRVWETPFSETRELKSAHTGECPPTLEEVLTQCDPQLNFIIELKNPENNPGLAEAVYEMLVKYDCFDRCVIQSSSYSMLRAFKQLSPDTRCGYILSFALGAYASLDAADFFSLDQTFVNETTLDQIHRLNKQLYAWTVNGEKDMRNLISLGVDGLITDDAPVAKNTLLSIWSSPLDELITEPIESALDIIDPNVDTETEEAEDAVETGNALEKEAAVTSA